ncbi:hypothetical protein JKP88DRAFT_313869 [Tribonema minus]|uniref:LOV domain-containing protein n=1 Tax=Tribonema minus TaxID=303371 RepID=A0A836CGM8_9STRA|nr:hypothetical protein JKP88DRAFT_313869 [Tribonema minus]
MGSHGGPHISFQGITLDLSAFDGLQFDFVDNQLVVQFASFTGKLVLQRNATLPQLKQPEVSLQPPQLLEPQRCQLGSELLQLDAAEHDLSMPFSQLEQPSDYEPDRDDASSEAAASRSKPQLTTTLPGSSTKDKSSGSLLSRLPRQEADMDVDENACSPTQSTGSCPPSQFSVVEQQHSKKVALVSPQPYAARTSPQLAEAVARVDGAEAPVTEAPAKRKQQQQQGKKRGQKAAAHRAAEDGGAGASDAAAAQQQQSAKRARKAKAAKPAPPFTLANFATPSPVRHDAKKKTKGAAAAAAAAAAENDATEDTEAAAAAAAAAAHAAAAPPFQLPTAAAAAAAAAPAHAAAADQSAAAAASAAEAAASEQQQLAAAAAGERAAPVTALLAPLPTGTSARPLGRWGHAAATIGAGRIVMYGGQGDDETEQRIPIASRAIAAYAGHVWRSARLRAASGATLLRPSLQTRTPIMFPDVHRTSIAPPPQGTFGDLHVCTLAPGAAAAAWTSPVTSNPNPNYQLNHEHLILTARPSRLTPPPPPAQATFGDLHVCTLAPGAAAAAWTSPVNCAAQPRAWEASCFLADKNLLVTFGGERGSDGDIECLDDIMVLDTEIFLFYPPATSGKPPSARSGHTAAILGKDVVVFGGARGSKWQNNLYALDTDRWQWRCPPTEGGAPKPRSYHSATAIGPDRTAGPGSGPRMLVFGGNSEGEAFNDVVVLEACAGRRWRWSRPMVMGDAPAPRTGHAAALLPDGRSVLVSGGWDPDVGGVKCFEDAAAADAGAAAADDEQETQLPAAAAARAAAAAQHMLVFIGGQDSNGVRGNDVFAVAADAV